VTAARGFADRLLRHHDPVPVGVIDVGSNTVRLHISRDGKEILREKAMLRLGEAIERHGSIPPEKLDETTEFVGKLAREARVRRVGRLEVLVTSPGRQAANGEELLARLASASGAPVRLLSAEEEGRLGFLGAMSASRAGSKRLIAVCDVGGGSAQVAVGTRRDGPSWIRSLDIGSMRLTSRMLEDDPPGDAAVARARDEVEGMLTGFLPPVPEIALAIGGSARALRSIGGSELGADELDEVAGILARTPGRDIAELYDIPPDRVRTLAAGAVLLGAIRERLHVPFRVVRGGVREGAALELSRELQAA
jgi:exopolyphosphatase/guanosine-5'-triphosphate,3'-diphosphate pyrophosphatase